MDTAASGWKRHEIGAPPSPEPEPEPAAVTTGVPPVAADLKTFIGEGCDFDGKLVVPGSFQIAGEFRGAIESPETVVVGPDAAVEASIRARTVLAI